MMNKKLGGFAQMVSLLLMALLSIISGACMAEQNDEREPARQIVLQGILGSKVLLLVDGNRQMMSVKDIEHQGVRVLRILEENVEVEIDGKKRILSLGGSHSVSGKFKPRKSTAVIIAKDKNGMYSTIGSINGLPVSFLVDTGASTIAMNAQHAKRLAIDFRVIGTPTFVGTASGVAKAYGVMLNKVTVGGINLSNVRAVVIDGRFPVQVLLGMTFLGQLEMQRKGAVLHLKQNH